MSSNILSNLWGDTIDTILVAKPIVWLWHYYIGHLSIDNLYKLLKATNDIKFNNNFSSNYEDYILIN